MAKTAAPATKLTRERAQEIYAAKGKGMFGSFACVVEDDERIDVEKVQLWLLSHPDYEGKRYIFWDEALAFIATGEVPPERPK